jgi:hypothetical protein
MENLEIYRKEGKIIIEIPIDEIVDLQNNISEDNRFYLNGNIYDHDAMVSYIIDNLKEHTDDSGDGYCENITKIESLLLDVINEAISDDVEFINCDFDEDDEYFENEIEQC